MELLAKDIQYLENKYKKLTYECQAEKITGELYFDLTFKKVKIKDKYKIEIYLSELDKSNLPKVRETENRILKIADRKKMDFRDLHLINKSGFLCLGIHPEIRKRYPNGFQFDEYLRHIEEHLYWVSFYERYDKAPWADHDHSIAGLKKIYTNKKNRSFIKEILEEKEMRKLNRSDIRAILNKKQ